MDYDNDKLKNTLKTVGKTAAKKVTKMLLPVVLVIILFAAFLYIIDGDATEYREGDMTSVVYSVSTYTENSNIDSTGEITSTSTAQKLWDDMISAGSRVDFYLDGPEQLLKLMNAELVTQFIDTRPNPDEEIDWDSINSDVNNSDIQGIIKLKRSDSEGNVYTMTYVDESTFQSYIDEYNNSGSEEAKKNALTCFTLVNATTSNSDGESSTTEYYAKVATWTEKKEVAINENISDENGEPDSDINQYTVNTYNMTTTNINYKDLVKGYTMPFDYLWQLLVISESQDFVLQLANLVYNSKIEITVYDNLTTNTYVNEYTYTKSKKTVTEATASAEVVSNESGRSWHSEQDSGTWEDEESTNYKTTITTTTKTNTLETSLTLADVWFAKYQKDYTNEVPANVTTSNEESLDDVSYEDTPSETTNNDTYGHGAELENEVKNSAKEYAEENEETLLYLDINYLNRGIDKFLYEIKSTLQVTEKIYQYSYTNRKEKTANTLQKNIYVASPSKVEEKTAQNSTEPNFVTILLDSNNSKAKSNILSVDSWLFEFMEENENTVDMVDLTKYLLYKATNSNYGVTEYDFDSLYRANITSVGSGDYIVNIDQSSENLVITDLETLKTAFSGYSGSSKLIENAEYFLEYQEKYRVNAVFAAAVSISETSAGRAGHATDGKNNWFNIECHCGDSSHGRFESYGTVEESIEKFYNLIANGTYYFQQENYTVSDIGMIYCEDADVPGGWIEDTNSYMTQMFESAGIDTSTGVASEGGITTEEERVELENYIQNELISTQYHVGNSLYQNGPFAKWWNSNYNTLQKFQCTWWAYGRASMYLEQYGSVYTQYPRENGRSGNGGEWYDINKTNGWFKYGSEPRANSIVSWKDGSYGHVAYVEGVTSDGKIYISHAGSGTTWRGVELVEPEGLWGMSLNGYIYLDEPN